MRQVILFATLLFLTLQTFAQPLWLRYNVISPQGDKIAFTYKGDIYVVDSKGGKSQQIKHTTTTLSGQTMARKLHLHQTNMAISTYLSYRQKVALRKE